MYWVANAFIFRRGDSPIHILDPRIKLLISIELFALSLISSTLIHIGISLAAIFTIAALAKILKRVYRTLMFSAGFSVLIFVINFLVGYSIITSFVLAVRFVAIVGSTSLFFLTTSPDELEYVLRWFKVPQDVIFAFVTAVRFVPVLMLDAIQIMDAQKSRGLELEKGNFINRIRKLAPILIPLVVTAVIRSSELAEAMEARAYGAVKKPTSLYTLTLKKRDKLVGIASIMLFTTLLLYFLNLTS
ncbi:MAG: energy-coupling factor transporter transmembrane component T [Nitrososphaerales archaeon]